MDHWLNTACSDVLGVISLPSTAIKTLPFNTKTIGQFALYERHLRCDITGENNNPIKQTDENEAEKTTNFIRFNGFLNTGRLSLNDRRLTLNDRRLSLNDRQIENDSENTKMIGEFSRAFSV